MTLLVGLNSSNSSHRIVPITCVDRSNGTTPETGEAGGQTQLVFGGAFLGNTNNTLSAVSAAAGEYVIVLQESEVSALGQGSITYESAAALPWRTDFQVVNFNPFSTQSNLDISALTALGVTRLDSDVTLRAVTHSGATIKGIENYANISDVTLTAGTITSAATEVWDRILTGSTHNIATSAGRRLRGIQEFQGYEGGAIWIDTVNGTAGTTEFENGTVENPVNSMADANTLSASLGIPHFEIEPGSSITLAAAQNNQSFDGENWTLALGGQDVAGTTFRGASVSGVMAGTGTMQEFFDCIINATSVIKGTLFINCQIANTITVVEAGEFLFRGCASSVAGAGTPTFDFGSALNSSNLSVRHHSGGWTIENMGAGTGTYNSTFEGHGQIIWAATCSATSNASIRGHWRITDNASGAVTETLDDITDDVTSILVDTGTTLDGRIPAALVGGRMDSNTGAISADATAADNLEAAFDGTGYDSNLTTFVKDSIATITGVTNTATLINALNDIDGSAVTLHAGTHSSATIAGIGTAGIQTATFAVGAIDAAAAATDFGQEMADRVLARDIASGSDSAAGGRSVQNSLRLLRNRVDASSSVLTVFQENDTSSAWTASLTTSADPGHINEINPL